MALIYGGGDNSNRTYGTGGDDLIFSVNAESDFLYGAAGNDVIYGLGSTDLRLPVGTVIVSPDGLQVRVDRWGADLILNLSESFNPDDVVG